MKILYIITELNPGGAENILLNLCEYFIKKHSLFIISLKKINEKSQIVKEIQGLKIPIYSLNLSITNFYNVFKIKEIVNKIKPDIIHAHLFHANIISRILLNNYPLINTIHTQERRIGKQYHFWIDKITFYLCKYHIAVSKCTQKFYCKKIGVNKNRVKVIENSIKIVRKEISIKEKEKIKKEWGINECKRIIGAIGRLDPYKGFDILIKACILLGKTYNLDYKIGLVILGEGKERAYLEKLARFSNNNIIISLPGYYKDAYQYIEIFDIFVNLSKYEGFGLTLLEAISYGTPLLITPLPSFLEILEKYNYTLYETVNTKYIIDISKKIYNLLNYKTRIKNNKIINNKLYSKIIYSHKEMLIKYERLYKEIYLEK